MGNDGGSIPTRRELVKEGAKDLSTTQVKEIQTEQQEHYWTTCALSHQPLSDPVVSDALGTLYNKDAVLSHLLSESQKETVTPLEILQQKKEAFKDRLRSLRDMVEVKFSHTDDDSDRKWICPITNKVLGPGTKAIYLVPCGHAFAASLISTVPGVKCLQCEQAYEVENVIPILPVSQEEKDALALRLENLKAKGLTHSLKKAQKEGGGGSSSKKKRKAMAAAGPVVPDDVQANGKSLLDDEVVAARTVKKMNGDAESTGGIKNRDTAALTEKVLKEQEERNKRRKMAGNENVQSLFSKGDGMESKKVDFMTRGFSIPAGGTKR